MERHLFRVRGRLRADSGVATRKEWARTRRGDGRRGREEGRKTLERCGRLIGTDRHYHRLQNSKAPCLIFSPCVCVCVKAVSRCRCVSLGEDVSCALGVRPKGRERREENNIGGEAKNKTRDEGELSSAQLSAGDGATVRRRAGVGAPVWGCVCTFTPPPGGAHRGRREAPETPKVLRYYYFFFIFEHSARLFSEALARLEKKRNACEPLAENGSQRYIF